jgi:hypothetical protein
MRPFIRAQYPNLKNTDVSSLLAKQWHAASFEEKKPHIERELREREKYHEDMSKWKEEEQQKLVLVQKHKITEILEVIENDDDSTFVATNEKNNNNKKLVFDKNQKQTSVNNNSINNMDLNTTLMMRWDEEEASIIADIDGDDVEYLNHLLLGFFF